MYYNRFPVKFIVLYLVAKVFTIVILLKKPRKKKQTIKPSLLLNVGAKSLKLGFIDCFHLNTFLD